MIFLSHTRSDKTIVGKIAQELSNVFGQEKIFYDSWSIKPGDSIIGSMDIGLQACKFFLFFVSRESLNSKMVDLEWKNGILKRAKENITFIPVILDNSPIPQIISDTCYIDFNSQGMDVTVRQIIDVITGNKIYREPENFNNIIAYITENNDDLLTIEFRAEYYMEPQSRYLILTDNSVEEISFKALGEPMFDSGFQKDFKLDTGLVTNAILIGRARPTSKGFPFIVQVTSKNESKLKFVGVMRAISQDNYMCIPFKK